MQVDRCVSLSVSVRPHSRYSVKTAVCHLHSWRYLLVLLLLQFSSDGSAATPSYCKINGGEYICTEPETRVGAWIYGGFSYDVNNWCFSGWPAAQCWAQLGEWLDCTRGCRNKEIPFNDDTIPQIGRDSLDTHQSLEPCTVNGIDHGWGDARAYDHLDAHEEEYKFGILHRSYRNLEFEGTRKASGDCSQSYAIEMEARKLRSINQYCPAGYESDHVEGVMYCRKRIDASCPLGNPVRPGTGEKIHTVVDFQIPQSRLLKVERSYSSFGFYRPVQGSLNAENLVRPADYWKFSWDKKLEFPESLNEIIAVAVRPGGLLDYIGSDGKSVYRYDGNYSRLKAIGDQNGGTAGWTLYT